MRISDWSSDVCSSDLHRTGLLPGAALVLAVAAVFPAWSVAIGGRAQPLPDQIDLPEIPGWHRAPLATNAPWTPYYPGTDHFLVGRYTDGADQIDIEIAVYADQHEGKERVSFGTGVLRSEEHTDELKSLMPKYYDT